MARNKAFQGKEQGQGVTFEGLSRTKKSNFRRTNVDEWAERQNGGRAMDSRHFSYDHGFGTTQK